MRLSDVRKIIKEELEDTNNVVSFSAGKAKKALKQFVSLVSPWIRDWDELIPRLRHAKLVLDSEEQQRELEFFVREFETAGENLSKYLKARKLEMTKSSKSSKFESVDYSKKITKTLKK
jgi:hypothetical protein